AGEQYRRLAQREAPGLVLEVLRKIPLLSIPLVLYLQHRLARRTVELLLDRLVPFHHFQQQCPQLFHEAAREPEPVLAPIGGRKPQQETILLLVEPDLDLMYHVASIPARPGGCAALRL